MLSFFYFLKNRNLFLKTITEEDLRFLNRFLFYKILNNSLKKLFLKTIFSKTRFQKKNCKTISKKPKFL